jgi:hypothetical protein
VIAPERTATGSDGSDGADGVSIGDALRCASAIET